MAPESMAMDGEGKAVVRHPVLDWSRADGDFVHQCPEEAIHCEALEAGTRRPTLELQEPVEEW